MRIKSSQRYSRYSVLLNSLKKQSTLYSTLLSSLVLLNAPSLFAGNYKPRNTIVIVVDQFSYDALQKYKPYFKHGLYKLITRGVNYTNAYHPHALPETATGHAALSTGTYPKDHGIIGNSWFNEKNEYIEASSDSKENAAVFSPTGTYDYGASSHLLMVDTLSDQFSLLSTPEKKYYAYSLSLKDRAATNMAGKRGKAIWFDDKTGYFTSSKAYFNELPAWINNFNKKHAMNQCSYVTWHQAKPHISKGYDFAYAQKFDYTTPTEGLVGKQVPIEWLSNPHDPFRLFIQTPHANKLLLDLAQTCIETHIHKKNSHQLLLWISLSTLDKTGHAFGPDSKETIDLIYHLDKQLESFMRRARRVVGQHETLFVLTSDHGVCPIVETMQKRGIPASRYMSKDIIKNLNDHLDKTDNISHIIKQSKGSQFYVDSERFNDLDTQQKSTLFHNTKLFLSKHPGVKKVWTYQELESSVFEPHSIENYYKNQLYPNRSGQIIVQLFPYYDITEWEKGADHTSPYDYNTHVPLILYQHGSIELRTVGQRVFTTQLANTLADILQIPKPSASTSERLPGIDAEINHLLF